MLARLEAHVAEQQRFAANASHELRTPLAITQTLLDVARSDRTRDPAELVDRLYAVNTRAIDLTEALLLLTRADQRSFAREPVDLSLIAEEATESLLPFAEEHGLTIETSGEETRTVGSPALLLQLCTNLLHNAIVHNLPGGGTVWVTTNVARRVRGADGREHRRAAHTRSWSPRSSSRSGAAASASAPTTPASGSAWRSSRASPRPTTGRSPSPPAPPGDCASPCSYPRSSPDRSPRSSTDTRNAKLSSRSRSKPKPLPTSRETKPCRAERTMRAAWVAASLVERVAAQHGETTSSGGGGRGTRLGPFEVGRVLGGGVGPRGARGVVAIGGSATRRERVAAGAPGDGAPASAR